MDFGLFLVTPCALVSCHILISKQEDDGASRALRSNRCVTVRGSRDENHAVRFRQSAENHSRAWDTQPIRSVSDERARGCKRWNLLSSGKDMRISPLSEYMFLHPPLTHHRNINPFENSVRDTYSYKEVYSFVHRSS